MKRNEKEAEFLGGCIELTAEGFVTVSQRRYDELIKKEAFYDELAKDKVINVYLSQALLAKEEDHE